MREPALPVLTERALVTAMIRLSTDDAPARERVAYWSDLVWRSFGRLRSDTYGDADFSGSISMMDLGAVRLCRLQAARHRVVRTAGCRGLSDPGYLKMVLQRRGKSLFEQDGRTAWLRPGDWSLYDTTRSYIVSAPCPVDLHILLLPREGILRGRAELAQLLVRRLRGASGMGRVACEAIETALEQADAGREPTDAGNRIVDLLHLALLEQSGERLEGTSGSVLRMRIKRHVEENLHDPELCVDSIARALNCSKRALHKAFEHEDCTLHGYIWERRLEAARKALEGGAERPRSITHVAFASGFNSAAHFSRAFRARYGASPREWPHKLKENAA
jgi:AraC-like DNA-binding protein